MLGRTEKATPPLSGTVNHHLTRQVAPDKPVARPANTGSSARREDQQKCDRTALDEQTAL